MVAVVLTLPEKMYACNQYYTGTRYRAIATLESKYLVARSRQRQAIRRITLCERYRTTGNQS